MQVFIASTTQQGVVYQLNQDRDEAFYYMT